jgi:GTP-binding protein
MNEHIRNLGIIAHVDHGKTTLVDKLLQQAGAFQAHEAVRERAMDSMDLEQEKGITIRAKNASVSWKGCTINIVDTPGHADFGGEVERIMGMVDGVLLLVDAAEGPQAQTRFVLQKALQHDLDLVVLINKIDRDLADPMKVHDQVLEILLELGAGEKQFHAPFLYASARDGFAVLDPKDTRKDMVPLLDTIVERIRPPESDPDGPFHMLISNLDWSDYLGRIAIGKIGSGSVAVNDSIVCINREGERVRSTVTRLYRFSGMGTTEIERGEAGDIIGLAGFNDAYIGETLCESMDSEPVPFVEMDPPTIEMQVCVNDGPLAGREGAFLTARHLRDRLIKETRTNISLEVADTDRGSAFAIRARGELQIAVLAETMRREGYELLLSRPQVIYREESGKKLEPYENLWLELPGDALGDVMQQLASRKANITDLQHHGSMVHVEARIPTRGLIGFESFLVNRTSGQSVLSHMFLEYAALCGPIETRNGGTLVSMEKGTATAYALDTIQGRGRLFIGPGEDVYEGMIIGSNSRSDDLPVNPTRTKKLTNVRASGTDDAIKLEPPTRMSLERAIEFIAPDEYVEATPKSLRLRKKLLNATARKRAAFTAD